MYISRTCLHYGNQDQLLCQIQEGGRPIDEPRNFDTVKSLIWAYYYMILDKRKPVFVVSDQVLHSHIQKMAGGFKFLIFEVERLYHLYSEIQLCC